MSPSATPATQSAAVSRRLKPAQARHPVPQVPRLPRKTRLCHACPRKTKVDGLCHACHAKRRRRRRRRRRRLGIQNQKQEPHTKLRGKKMKKIISAMLVRRCQCIRGGGTAAMLIRLCIRFVRHLDSLTWPLIYILGGCPLKGHVRRDGAAGDLVPLNVHVGGSAAENIYHAGTWGPS